MTVTRIPRMEIQNVEHSAFVAVRCPVCHKGRLMNAARGVDISQMQLSGSEQFERCQCYIKCPKCGRQIGVSFGKAGNRPLRKQLLH